MMLPMTFQLNSPLQYHQCSFKKYGSSKLIQSCGSVDRIHRMGLHYVNYYVCCLAGVWMLTQGCSIINCPANFINKSWKLAHDNLDCEEATGKLSPVDMLLFARQSFSSSIFREIVMACWCIGVMEMEILSFWTMKCSHMGAGDWTFEKLALATLRAELQVKLLLDNG